MSNGKDKEPPPPTSTPTSTEAAETKTGGKPRSETPYPYYGLSKAIEIAKAVQRAAGNAAAPAADVLRELGVQKTDRLWAYGIPASILFGLIERIGRGDDALIKLTDLGRRIALPGGPDEERATKANALKTPELYSKLLEQFADNPVPTKDALKNILQRDFKIVESMAGNAADAFLESLKVAELITPTGTITNGASSTTRTDDKGDKPVDQPAGPPPGTQMMTVPADFIIYRCKIGGGRIIDIALPPKFRQTDVDKLHAFLKTQIDDEPVAEIAGRKEGAS